MIRLLRSGADTNLWPSYDTTCRRDPVLSSALSFVFRIIRDGLQLAKEVSPRLKCSVVEQDFGFRRGQTDRLRKQRRISLS